MDQVVGGTSAAAPLWAAFTTQVNQFRVLNGFNRIGFINKSLYSLATSSSYASDFHDIADGSNNLFYSAVTGYDMATGLGTFNGLSLISDLGGKAAPAPPAPVTVSLSGSNVLINWTPSSGATGFNIYRSTSPTTGFTEIASVPAPTNTYADTYPATVGGNFYYEVTATNPTESQPATPDKTATNPVQWPIHVAAPPPVIGSLSPAQVPAGSPAFTLTINGTNFFSTSVVEFNGASLPTTYVSANVLTALVPASSVATPTSATNVVNVVVVNVGESGSSVPQAFTITNPQPTVSAVSPGLVLVGTATDTTITVTGTGFWSGTTITATPSGGSGTAINLLTTYVSSTKVTAVFPATSLQSLGTFDIGAFNPSSPAPGGVSTSTALFTVGNPVPVVSALGVLTSGTAGDPFIGAGSGDFTLVVQGSGFLNGTNSSSVSSVTWTPSGSSSSAVVLSNFDVTATQIQVLVPAALVTVGGQIDVTVTNPAPGGGTTSPLTFVITNPVPVLNRLTAILPGIVPSSVGAGSGDLTLTINGGNFVNSNPSPTITIGSTTYPTTFVSSTQLTALIPAAALAAGAVEDVTVANPPPIGGIAVDPILRTNQTLTFTIYNQIPVLSGLVINNDASIDPTTRDTGDIAFTLTVNGSNFVQASKINFDGGALATTYISPTQISTFVPASKIAFAHDASVTVVTGTPGGGTSNAATIVVKNPVPTLDPNVALSPSNVDTGSGSFTLQVTGTKFMPGCTVLLNNTAYTPTNLTTAGSSTTATVTVPASLTDVAQKINVTVVNPGPGGGQTAATAVLSVVDPTPTIASISPNVAVLNSPSVTLTVTGTKFTKGTLVNWSIGNVNAVFTPISVDSATSLTVTIPSSQLTAIGSATITLANAGGSKLSTSSATFTVSSAPAIVSGLSPTSVTAGSPDFQLTISGENFAAGGTAATTSTVTFNGTTATVDPKLSTTTSLVVTITKALVATAGSYQIVVTSPDGVASSAVQFDVTAAKTFPAGLQMISTPYDYSGVASDFATILATTSPKVAVWLPDTAAYAVAPTAPADVFRLGQAYWARFATQTPLAVVGKPLDPGTLLSKNFVPGWSQVGDPFTQPIRLEDILVYDANGVKYSWAQAASATVALVSPYVFSYDTTAHVYVTHAVGAAAEADPTLVPYTGYWFLINQNVRLVFTNPTKGS
jgi:hypothetical protein